RLTARLLHHLADKEAEQALLAAAISGDLALVCGEDLVDDRCKLAGVRDRRLGEVPVRTKARLCASRHGRRECLTRDLTATLDELTRRLDRDEVGLGEVTVVLGFLLRAVQREPAGRRVEVQGLLDDVAAGLVDGDLALDLRLDPLRDEAKGVDVLELGTRP